MHFRMGSGLDRGGRRIQEDIRHRLFLRKGAVQSSKATRRSSAIGYPQRLGHQEDCIENDGHRIRYGRHLGTRRGWGAWWDLVQEEKQQEEKGEEEVLVVVMVVICATIAERNSSLRTG